MKGLPVTATSDATRYQAKGVRLIAHQGTPRHTVRELNQVVSILGSGEGCEVVLSSKRVAESHAAIVLLGSAAYLCDLGASSGTQLNGKRIRWARMEGSDAVTIGPFTFVAEVEDAPEYAVMEEPIFCLKGDERIGVISSIDPVLVVGRDPSCDVVLDHESIAPRHSLVVWTRQGPVVRALADDMQTRLNGRRVQFGYINNGDRIGAGPFELRFEAGAGPATARRSAHGETIEYRSPGSDGVRIIAAPALVAGSLPEDTLDGAHALWPAAAGAVPAAETAPAAATEGARQAARPPGGERADGERRTRQATAVLEERIDAKAEELRQRVAAAQSALDERARRHRERIQEERQRLDIKKAQLDRQARALVELSRQGRSGRTDDAAYAALEPSAAPGVCNLDNDGTPAAADLIELGPGESHIQELLGGSIDLSDLAEFNGQETERGVEPAPVGITDASLHSLEERVSELLSVAQSERRDIERGEAMVETLRFETERQRTILTRRQEKLHSRERALEERFRAYAESRERIRRERAPLLARLRQLDAEDNALRGRVSESERLHQELVHEAEQLDAIQERLETRERELLHKLEKERQRLQLRQQDLQRKVTKLAKAAREKRLAIENEVAAQQAELEAREAELRARRMQIEDAARGELQRTATELENVLNVRLTDIEADLMARRQDLETKLRELAGGPAPAVARNASLTMEGSLRTIASELAAFNRTTGTDREKHGQLDELQMEIEAFSRLGLADGETAEPALASAGRRRTRGLADALEAGVGAFAGTIRDSSRHTNAATADPAPKATPHAMSDPEAAIFETVASGQEHHEGSD